MKVQIRRVKPDDAPTLGRICFQAFKAINERHGFLPDFPSVEVATAAISGIISRPEIYGIAAEAEGRLIGSNFLYEGSPIAGIGPITVDPDYQDQSVGRQLMEAMLQRTREGKLPGVRLVQAAFHNRSLSLYTKLGFQVREPLACIRGTPIGAEMKGYRVRPLTADDLPACDRLCSAVHGHDRSGELRYALDRGTAHLVERDGRITGYSSILGYVGHAVGAANDDLKALISAAKEFHGPGLLVPARNTEVFSWCLSIGLRVTQPMTLMTMGLYNEPQGAYLPSILY